MYEAQAVREHPAPGKLVAVEDGRRIHIDCRGTGSPTVVFQSGGDLMGALGWQPVMQQVSQKSRACAYSRAGILWSDPASDAFTPEEVARDLHAALDAAGESGPYVLVSHSRGGLYSMIFAGLYKDEIAGMVFADSSHPDQEAKFRQAGLSVGDYVSPAQELALAFKWTGLMRLSDYPADPAIAETVNAFYPKSAEANAREARQRSATMTEAGKHRDLQNWPVVVLARELPQQTQARKRADAHDAYLLSCPNPTTPSFSTGQTWSQPPWTKCLPPAALSGGRLLRRDSRGLVLRDDLCRRHVARYIAHRAEDVWHRLHRDKQTQQLDRHAHRHRDRRNAGDE